MLGMPRVGRPIVGDPIVPPGTLPPSILPYGNDRGKGSPLYVFLQLLRTFDFWGSRACGVFWGLGGLWRAWCRSLVVGDGFAGEELL